MVFSPGGAWLAFLVTEPGPARVCVAQPAGRAGRNAVFPVLLPPAPLPAYLTWLGWAGQDTLVVSVSSHTQTRHQTLLCHAPAWQCSPALTERHTFGARLGWGGAWLLAGGGMVTRAAVRDGPRGYYQQLVCLSAGRLVPVTLGAGEVGGVIGSDPVGGIVYTINPVVSPHTQQVYRVAGAACGAARSRLPTPACLSCITNCTWATASLSYNSSFLLQVSNIVFFFVLFFGITIPFFVTSGPILNYFFSN